jgi:hypothetical protein
MQSSLSDMLGVVSDTQTVDVVGEPVEFHHDGKAGTWFFHAPGIRLSGGGQMTYEAAVRAAERAVEFSRTWNQRVSWWQRALVRCGWLALGAIGALLYLTSQK